MNKQEKVIGVQMVVEIVDGVRLEILQVKNVPRETVGQVIKNISNPLFLKTRNINTDFSRSVENLFFQKR
jgi:hypothetical protein